MFNEKIIKVACRVRETYLKKLFKRLIITLKKKYKTSFFVEKHVAKSSGFAVTKEAVSP